MTHQSQTRISLLYYVMHFIAAFSYCTNFPLFSKSTEETHADKCHLVDAVNGMTDVAAAINEFKRRKDLGQLKILF